MGLKRNWFNISTAGIKNAKVFPLPVLAAPSTSFPASKGGIVRAWTSVIVSNPILPIAEVVAGDKDRVEKGTRSYGAVEAELEVVGRTEEESATGVGASRVTLEEEASGEAASPFAGVLGPSAAETDLCCLFRFLPVLRLALGADAAMADMLGSSCCQW